MSSAKAKGMICGGCEEEIPSARAEVIIQERLEQFCVPCMRRREAQEILRRQREETMRKGGIRGLRSCLKVDRLK